MRYPGGVGAGPDERSYPAEDRPAEEQIQCGNRILLMVFTDSNDDGRQEVRRQSSL